MADITMCKNEFCTLKETCYRYKAIPNPYAQSYNTFVQDKDEYCEMYWELEPKSNENETKTN